MYFDERISRMRQAMQAADVDALILTLPENVLLLSGYWPMIGATVLVFPLEGPAFCIIPDCYQLDAAGLFGETETICYSLGVLSSEPPLTALRKALNRCATGKSWKRIGYEGSFGVMAPSWNCAEFMVPFINNRECLEAFLPDRELMDVSALLQDERSRKTAFEIEKLRLASEVSTLGLEAFERLVQPGISGVELAAGVEHEVMVQGTGLRGAVRVRAFAQVAVGEQETAVGYRPNETSTARRLRDGDIALLELGVVVDGYWADRTRVRVAGTPSDEQVSIFEVVHEAQRAAISAAGPGVACAEVDAAARDVIRAAGYEAYFPHVTGHGLGFRYHESHHLLSPSSTETLPEGALITIEPGIYRRPSGGFRIEDDVIVTRTGAEILGPYPSKLC